MMQQEETRKSTRIKYDFESARASDIFILVP